MQQPLTVDQVFDKAADYIQTHGWTQGVYESDEGEVCAVGAMMMVTTETSQDYVDDLVAAKAEMKKYLADTLDRDTRERLWWVGGDKPITSWNDLTGQTANNVTVTLRNAAKRYRESH